MTIAKEPYFLNDPDWFRYDETEGRYFLTDKAPQKAVDSYQEYYSAFGDGGEEIPFDEAVVRLKTMQGDFYKNDPDDVIWWQDTPDQVGVWLFSFDKKKVFNLFRDYPHELTKEQKEIFDRENPYWADFFSDRQ